MSAVTHACADCLEEAGGRQLNYSINWQLGICGSCGRKRGVIDPAHFGSPEMVHTAMEDILQQREEFA